MLTLSDMAIEPQHWLFLECLASTCAIIFAEATFRGSAYETRLGKCVRCAKAHADGTRFCTDCGGRIVCWQVVHLCPKCNIVIYTAYCDECGARPRRAFADEIFPYKPFHINKTSKCTRCGSVVLSLENKKYCGRCGGKLQPEPYLECVGCGQTINHELVSRCSNCGHQIHQRK
jgi:hypothetical protein